MALAGHLVQYYPGYPPPSPPCPVLYYYPGSVLMLLAWLPVSRSLTSPLAGRARELLPPLPAAQLVAVPPLNNNILLLMFREDEDYGVPQGQGLRSTARTRTEYRKDKE